MAHKTKIIKCSKCGVDMEVGLFSRNVQMCSKCSSAHGGTDNQDGKHHQKKTKIIQCARCGVDMEVHIYAKNTQLCPKCIAMKDKQLSEDERDHFPYDRRAVVRDFMDIGFVFSKKKRCIVKKYDDDNSIIIDIRDNNRFIILYSYKSKNGVRTGKLITTIGMLNTLPYYIRKDISLLVKKYASHMSAPYSPYTIHGMEDG